MSRIVEIAEVIHTTDDISNLNSAILPSKPHRRDHIATVWSGILCIVSILLILSDLSIISSDRLLLLHDILLGCDIIMFMILLVENNLVLWLLSTVNFEIIFTDGTLTSP